MGGWIGTASSPPPPQTLTLRPGRAELCIPSKIGWFYVLNYYCLVCIMLFYLPGCVVSGSMPEAKASLTPTSSMAPSGRNTVRLVTPCRRPWHRPLVSRSEWPWPPRPGKRASEASADHDPTPGTSSPGSVLRSKFIEKNKNIAAS